MRALGDRPASEITTREIGDLLAEIQDTGVGARMINKHRQLVVSIYQWALDPETPISGIEINPATATKKRKLPQRPPLDWYRPAEVERLAEAADSQDGEMLRLAAYTGLRRGELLALRWRDIDWTGARIVVSRAMSAGVEGETKSSRARNVPWLRRYARRLSGSASAAST